MSFMPKLADTSLICRDLRPVLQSDPKAKV